MGKFQLQMLQAATLTFYLRFHFNIKTDVIKTIEHNLCKSYLSIF
jgi:hypothetical protein